MMDTADAQLFVRAERDCLEYQLNVLRPCLGVGIQTFSPVAWGPASAALVDSLLHRLEGVSADGTGGWLAAEEELAGIGLELCDHLIHANLGAALRELVDRTPEGQAPSLLVLSQEPAIPWELVKLRRPDDGSPGPFLAEAFALTRWLDGPKHVFELPLRHLALVAPADSKLETRSEERAFLLGLGGEDREVTEVPARLEPLLENLASGHFDGWHFTGHGLAAGKDPSGWSLLLERGKPLSSYLLKNSARHLGEAHPLVFANACRSARRGPGMTRVGGLAQTFLELGAAAFVGTLWAIQDEFALKFACAFYRRFVAGVAIGEAVRQARLELRDADPGNASWLGYTVFAHPLARCESSYLQPSSPTAAGPLELPRISWRPDRSPPGALLRAEYGVVPFHGRDPEMAELRNWCDEDAAFALRLYTGPGGMGKTRLALELCRRLRDAGWLAGFVPRGGDVAVGEVVSRLLDAAGAESSGLSRKLLAVVDYSESRRDLLIPLLQRLARREKGRSRVLLLARAAIDWWDQLKAERDIGEILSGPATTRHALRPLAFSPEERAASYRLAASAFSERLGQAPPEQTPDDLAAEHYERALLLHMTALAAIEGVDVKGEDGILDFVLNREHRFWHERARQRGIASDLVPGIGRALAVVTMGGGLPDEARAVNLLGRLTFYEDQPVSVRANVARLLHECYPGSQWIEPLLPDLLGEHLVERELQESGEELLDLTMDPDCEH